MKLPEQSFDSGHGENCTRPAVLARLGGGGEAWGAWGYCRQPVVRGRDTARSPLPHKGLPDGQRHPETAGYDTSTRQTGADTLGDLVHKVSSHWTLHTRPLPVVRGVSRVSSPGPAPDLGSAHERTTTDLQLPRLGPGPGPGPGPRLPSLPVHPHTLLKDPQRSGPRPLLSTTTHSGP